MENEVWYCGENYYPEYFDNEETARLAYTMWCNKNNETFDEEIFRSCYGPLSHFVDIWTKDTIHEYEP